MSQSSLPTPLNDTSAIIRYLNAQTLAGTTLNVHVPHVISGGSRQRPETPSSTHIQLMISGLDRRNFLKSSGAQGHKICVSPAAQHVVRDMKMGSWVRKD